MGRALNYVPHKQAAWVLWQEPFGELVEYCSQLARHGSLAAAFTEIGAVLAELQRGLASVESGRRCPKKERP